MAEGGGSRALAKPLWPSGREWDLWHWPLTCTLDYVNCKQKAQNFRQYLVILADNSNPKGLLVCIKKVNVHLCCVEVHAGGGGLMSLLWDF